MQLLHSDTPAEADSLRPAEQEEVEIDAFIEAQLRTGVLLLDALEWQQSASPHLHGFVLRDEVTS